MCARLMRCWPALLLLFHFFRKSGFWVACQVLFAKILTNFMSALFIRRCWCLFWTPTCRAEHFCNNGFFAINDAAEWERICRGGGRFGQTSFSFYLFSISKSVIFFSCVRIIITYNCMSNLIMCLKIIFPKRKCLRRGITSWEIN